MKIFECQNCGQPLYFENTKCESCGLRLGYLPKLEVITALREAGPGRWNAMAAPNALYHFCANAEYDVCNWLLSVDHAEVFCEACRHNRTIPDLTLSENLLNWRKIEWAKHRLFYSILKFRLPVTKRPEDPCGLAFDFLSPSQMQSNVYTGHAAGLITLNVAEADDLERERQRTVMGEPYRTLLGHFRHEIAHYFWDHLVARSPSLGQFRELFGDERKDYQSALKRHYTEAPPTNWLVQFVTPYASAHPWEDFAETWAHYLHMVDTLETASAFGLGLNPAVGKQSNLQIMLDFDPYTADIQRIIKNWLPLTFAVNSINRSMGQHDLYPFILPPKVIAKLKFVHNRIHRLPN